MGLSLTAQISNYPFSKDVSLSQLTFSGILPDFSTVEFKESGIHIFHVHVAHLIKWKICCIYYFYFKK